MFLIMVVEKKKKDGYPIEIGSRAHGITRFVKSTHPD